MSRYINKNTKIGVTKTEGAVSGIFPLGEGNNIVELQPLIAYKKDAIDCANNLVIGNHTNNYVTVSGVSVINTIKFNHLIDGTVIVLILAGTQTVKHNQSGDSTYAPILLNGGADMEVTAFGTLTLIYDSNIESFIELSRCAI